MIEIAVKVHEIATDGLPDMAAMSGRVAFIFDGCIVSGWPLVDPGDPDVADVYERYGMDPGDGWLWEADSDVVGAVLLFSNVTHWVELPSPVWKLVKRSPL